MILGVIPARAGSKGIKNKNIYPLCGKPLIEYTYCASVLSDLSHACITTNDSTIIEWYGSRLCHNRDSTLCQDDTPMVPVIQDAVIWFERKWNKHVDAIMILQPTSPLRTWEDIDKAIELFNDNNVDSLYSGYYMGIKHNNKTYDKHIDKPHLQRNGAIFITRRDLLDQGKLWSDNAIEFIMPSYRSIDIDTMEDMKHAELLLKGGVLND